MAQPYSFSWIEKPQLAALGRPDSVEDLEWLPSGIHLLVSLTEDPPNNRKVNEALAAGARAGDGYVAPTQAQLRCCGRQSCAHEGTAAWLCIARGLAGLASCSPATLRHERSEPRTTASPVRCLRPGSVETEDQGVEAARVRPDDAAADSPYFTTRFRPVDIARHAPTRGENSTRPA